MIKYIYLFFRLEKALLQPVTRASTGKLPSNRITETSAQNRANAIIKTLSSPSTVAPKQASLAHKSSSEEIKEKMEQELRLQRAEHHKKRTLEMMHQKKGIHIFISFYSRETFKTHQIKE